MWSDHHSATPHGRPSRDAEGEKPVPHGQYRVFHVCNVLEMTAVKRRRAVEGYRDPGWDIGVGVVTGGQRGGWTHPAS